MSKRSEAAEVSYETTGARQIRATALGRGTYGVPDVRRLVESQFHVAFPHRIWVAGQVGLPLEELDGTLRFTLQAATGDEPFSVRCVVPGPSLPALSTLLDRMHDAVLPDVVREGRLVRAGGLLRFDAVRNCVALVVSELDPTPTAAELAEAREHAIRAVSDAGLAHAQQALTCRSAPVRVAVVGGADDEALPAVQAHLAESGFGVTAQLKAVALSGTDGPGLLARAVRSAAQDADVVLLARGSGRPLGLATFDALEVAHAVAEAPVPVVTGLGGAGVRTACDEVAFAVLPTADGAAGWVLARLQAAEAALDALTGEVEQAAVAASVRCRQALDEAQADVAQAAEAAALRSAAVRERARRRLLIGCALAAVLVVVAALVLAAPLVLLLLLVPLVVLGGVQLWWRRAGRSRRMTGPDDDFAQVVERLHGVREELETTSSPERVAALRETADRLLARGRELLGRHLPAPSAPAAGAPSEPTGTDTVALAVAAPTDEPQPSGELLEQSPSAGWVEPDAGDAARGSGRGSVRVAPAPASEQS